MRCTFEDRIQLFWEEKQQQQQQCAASRGEQAFSLFATQKVHGVDSFFFLSLLFGYKMLNNGVMIPHPSPNFHLGILSPDKSLSGR